MTNAENLIDDDDKIIINANRIFLAVIAFALIAALTYYYYFYANGVSEKTDAWGQLGDYFGGVLNPIIGLATVYLILVSIRLQKAELKQTRDELKNSSKALDKQSKIMKIQQFESSFFSWLNSYRSLVESVRRSQVSYSLSFSLTGLEALHNMFKAMNETSNEEEAPLPSSIEEYENIFENKKNTFIEIFNENNNDLSRIVRYLTEFIHWIDDNKSITKSQKWQYVGHLKAQLSQTEFEILFYCSIVAEKNSILTLVNKYALLTNLDLTRERTIVKRFAIESGKTLTSNAFDFDVAKTEFFAEKALKDKESK